MVNKVIFAFIRLAVQGDFQSSCYLGQVCLLSLIHQRHNDSLASYLAQHGTPTSVQSNPVSVVTSVSMPSPSGMPLST